MFDFNNLRVRIWVSTFKGQGQNYFCCSKAHIIISYSIFDFMGFMVWPLTYESHLGLKKSHTILKPIYDFLFDFYGHHASLYFVPFSSYSTSKFLGFDLDLWRLKVVWGRRNYTIWRPIYDFLFDFYGHHLSISYRFRYIRLQSS